MKSFDAYWIEIERRYVSGYVQKKRDRLIQALMQKPLVVFGAGFLCNCAVTTLARQGIETKCICDNFKTGIEPTSSLHILYPDDLPKYYPDANILITAVTTTSHDAMKKQIIALGFSQDQVFSVNTAIEFLDHPPFRLQLEEFLPHLNGYRNAFNTFKDELSRKIVIARINSYLFNDFIEDYCQPGQYFPNELQFSEDEIFVDGGLYIGDTTEEFIRTVNNKYHHIYGFEIDNDTADRARGNLQYNRVDVIPYGLWSHRTNLIAHINNMHHEGSAINPNGSVTVPVTSLDDFFSTHVKSELPTMIKLDIEGAERKAIEGGIKTISKARPKMAVCVYHQTQDLYELPELIMRVNPDYKLMLRHHSPLIFDTVLYAY